ncbi:putative rhamnogalacturonate lyase B [Cinnamomum micranthum f. kanehirae]|uniref:Putative rhamnogalacturonate lyase B n=1 Tax=Cinnamomum micranthum f. kanehirae TaxID=337451 RepID=A0A443N3G9_9MAGN|nr:putative rhamnogalacturonate lyase B [Cinnamomum micranthum f. kanehirae]
MLVPYEVKKLTPAMMMIQPKNLTKHNCTIGQQNVSYELHWKKRKSRLYPPISLGSLLLHDEKEPHTRVQSPKKSPSPFCFKTMARKNVNLTIQGSNVIMENGILKLTMSQPDGALTGIQYGGMDNLLDTKLSQSQRGYWDINWNLPGRGDRYLLFILRSGISGFYCYAIYERLAGWPAFDLVQTRLVFKLRRELFHYMAITDEKQRIMPMPEDLSHGRCEVLALPESVLLTNPINPALKGEAKSISALTGAIFIDLPLPEPVQTEFTPVKWKIEKSKADLSTSSPISRSSIGPKTPASPHDYSSFLEL